jgi:hypothetical protein
MRYGADMQLEGRHRDLSDLAGSMTAAEVQASLESVAKSDGASLSIQTNRDLSFMGDLSGADAQDHDDPPIREDQTVAVDGGVAP